MIHWNLWFEDNDDDLDKEKFNEYYDEDDNNDNNNDSNSSTIGWDTDYKDTKRYSC